MSHICTYLTCTWPTYLVAEEPVLFLHTLLSFFLGGFLFFFEGTRSLGKDCLFQLHVRMRMRMMIILPPALVLLLTFSSSSSSIPKASKFPSYPLLFYPTPVSHTLIFYLMPSTIAPFLHTSLLLFLPLLFYALAIIFPSNSSSSIRSSSSSSVDISSSAYDWNRDELPKCKKLLIRKEWRSWTRREKMEWVGAVKVRCLRYPILLLIFFFFPLLCTRYM